MRTIAYIASLVTLLGGVACSDGNVFIGEAGSNTSSSDGSTGGVQGSGTGEAPPSDESAKPPQIISGTFLDDVAITCADATVDQAAAGEVGIGCSLADRKDGRVVPLDAFAESWQWRARPDAASTQITVRVLELAGAEQQAYFLFRGAGEADLRAAADLTIVSLDVKVKPDAGFEVQGFSNRVKEAKKRTVYASSNPPPLAEQVKLEALAPELDRDADGIPNGEDQCNATPAGAKVWTSGEWKGCTGGEFRDADDTDLDRVANIYDKCPNTPFGRQVVMTVDDPRRGCADGEVVANSINVNPFGNN